jgi:hypothetical protein
MRSGMMVGWRTQMAEVVTLRRRRRRRSNGPTTAMTRKVRIVRRKLVGEMMPWIMGGRRPVAVALRWNGRTAACADATRGYSGSGSIRMAVVSMLRRVREVVDMVWAAEMM